MIGITRRDWLGLLAGGGVTSIAGCSGAANDATRTDADVIVGPDGRLVFDPEEVTVSAGEPVAWYLDSAGHNVSGRPADHDLVSLPAGAEPFASYGPNDSPPVPRPGRHDVRAHLRDAGDPRLRLHPARERQDGRAGYRRIDTSSRPAEWLA